MSMFVYERGRDSGRQRKRTRERAEESAEESGRESGRECGIEGKTEADSGRERTSEYESARERTRAEESGRERQMADGSGIERKRAEERKENLSLHKRERNKRAGRCGEARENCSRPGRTVLRSWGGDERLSDFDLQSLVPGTSRYTMC